MILLRLFWEFFQIGLFSVGGGLATLPFLYNLGARTGWFSSAQVADMLAVSESTPGPIGVNMATYVGYTTAGIAGSVCATLGLITPSIIIILLVAAAMKAFRNNRYVEAAFYTLRPASTGLITAAGWSVVMLVLVNTELFKSTGVFTDLFIWRNLLLFAVLFILTNFIKPIKKLHPIVFILFAAVCGIVFRLGGA
ncbi:MAG: chromate transporter [Oscillospiraceae bacterium]|nr:chromate transporter [Oscillospiraceae bacterium]